MSDGKKRRNNQDSGAKSNKKSKVCVANPPRKSSSFDVRLTIAVTEQGLLVEVSKKLSNHHRYRNRLRGYFRYVRSGHRVEMRRGDVRATGEG